MKKSTIIILAIAAILVGILGGTLVYTLTRVKEGTDAVENYLDNSKKEMYKNNLSSFVDAVKEEVKEEGLSLGSRRIFKFNAIELERGSNTRSPLGEYIQDKSCVVVTKSTSGYYTYEIQALDNKQVGTKAKVVTTYDDIQSLEITSSLTISDAENICK